MRLESLITLKLFNSSLSELFLLFKLDKQFSIERFEPIVSQSTVPSPLLVSYRIVLRSTVRSHPASFSAPRRAGSCRCAIIRVPWCLRRLSTFLNCFERVFGKQIPHAKHAETKYNTITILLLTTIIIMIIVTAISYLII